MHSRASDRDLIASARSGDRAALGQLFVRYSEYLLRLISKLMGAGLRRTLEPSDVLQETLLIAAARFHDFKGMDERELRTWFSALARRKLIDLARHNGRLKRALKSERSLDERDTTGNEIANQLRSDLCTASQIAVNREMSGKLLEALTHIEPRDAEVLWLRYVDGLSYQSIGRRIGIGRNGVRGMVARGLRNLRGLMPPL